MAAPIRLLAVDDSALMRRLLRDILTVEDGFELCTAASGAEALRVLPEIRPDVVTLDVTMPGMDGLACLEAIMLDAPRPVVMLSALTQEGAEITLEALRLGAVDFVAKPEGAVSLGLDRLRCELPVAVRNAATARIPRSFRLAERVRSRLRAGLAGGVEPAARHVPVIPARAIATGGPDAQAGGLVVMGASTGGPAAIEAILCALPAGFPWPVVVAQHMPAPFTGAFARRLDGRCSVRVEEVAGGPVRPRPGTVHIARGGADLVVARRPGGLVLLTAPPDARAWHPSVDRLVFSALDALPAGQLLGVLLTGMGSDGAEAMATLSAAGGRTIAQDEASAVVWGMPGEMVRRGGADRVLPAEDIAAAMLAWSPCPAPEESALPCR